ncbi:MAG: hypothetical protein ABJB05_06855 [Parafilimonas sp.]
MLPGTFPSPTVAPAALNTAATRLELAYANRMNGAAAKTDFETADKAVDDLLHTEAAYVNSIANGNSSIIEAAGFTATSNKHTRAVVPGTPNAPAVTGNAAALHLIIPAIQGADSYCWVIFTGDAANATIAETHIALSGAAIVIPDGTTREVLHNVIAAGTKITVQVLAQNTAGKSGFSSAVTFTVGS